MIEAREELIPVDIYVESQIHYLNKEKARLIEEINNPITNHAERDVKTTLVVYIENEINSLNEIKLKKKEQFENKKCSSGWGSSHV